MKRMAEVEDQLAEKASKQTVAQALHRKMSKEDFAEAVGSKAEATDLSRIVSQLETKADAIDLN